MIIKKKTLIAELYYELLGKAVESSNIIKINSENLGKNGEIYFPANLLAWRGLKLEEILSKNCNNILEYYIKNKNFDTGDLSELDISEKAVQLLISASESWIMRVKECRVLNNRVSLYLDRKNITEIVIKEVLKKGVDYGAVKSKGNSISLKINKDKDSDMTNMRLKLIKEVSQRILEAQGLTNHENTDIELRYILTTKSQGILEDGYIRFICGVVKDQDSDSKETSRTWQSYLDKKMTNLANVAEDKYEKVNNVENLKEIAKADAIFELLSVKPSRPAFIQTKRDSSRNVSNSKGGSFVLYNAARINAILERFKKEECIGNYPNLTDVNNVDFSLLNQEEEWELIYNFILQYPELIENCVETESQFETHPQMLCLFLTRLCQKFSVYYRRIRVLTEGRDHLVPTMMARLHLLRSLQIVVNNSLAILNITPVTHM